MIVLENISKKYLIGIRKSDRLKDYFSDFFAKKKSKEFWALKDISFRVEPGEKIGLLGLNGAGKSTLLKIISSITTPTRGSCKVSGRLVSLLEVGSGFHPELTGRENIYLNGAILGMTKREIDKKFKDIVDFSGVATFLDLPVKRFSSGMYARLGFSVAIHANPQILVVDEVFSVGDFAFQQSCIKKLAELEQGGLTLFFVGHHLSLLISLCKRGILLDQGALIFDGPVQECAEKYSGEAVKGGLWEGELIMDGLTFYLVERVQSQPASMQEGSLQGNECKVKIKFKNLGKAPILLEIYSASQVLVASSLFNPKMDSNVQEIHFCLDTHIFHPGHYFIRINQAITLSFPLYQDEGLQESFINSRLSGISLGNRWVYGC